MRAIAFMEFGGPEVLRIADLPEPAPGPGEAVVRVRASTVNPTDIMMRSGKQSGWMSEVKPPYVCGVEFSGNVHRLGENGASLRVGQTVMGIVNARRQGGGAHAEYVRVPAAALVPAPDGLDPIEAATLPMNGLTAKMCIEALKLPAGSTILVTGGAGALGGYVVQLARQAGLKVVADAKESDVELLRQLGVDEIVPRGEGMVTAIRRLHPDGVDGLVDGAILTDRAAAAVRDGGSAIALRRTNLITDPRLRSSAVAVFEQATNTDALHWVAEQARRGVLTPRIGRLLPMAEAAEAYRLVEQGGMRGRVVLTF